MWINNYTFNKNETCFLHIQKTGGSTIHKLLEGKDNIYLYPGWHTCISTECRPEEYSYITFLREPLDRCWSHVNNITDITATGVIDFINSRQELSNLYTKLLSNKSEYVVPSSNNKNHLGWVGDRLTEKDLEDAKINLSNFKFVGLFENFEEDTKKMYDVVFNETLNEVPHINKRTNKYPRPFAIYNAPRPEHIVNEFKKNNELDIELYKWVKNELRK